MKKWYFLLLICTGIGGWFAYPHIYPKVIAIVEDGTLPWSGFGKTDESAEKAEDATVAVNTSSPIPGNPRSGRTRPGAAAPKFAPIDEIVGNWNAIPKSAFPRKIKLLAPVTYKIAGGTGSLASGADVVALSSSEDGLLTVAPNESSALRGEVAIDKTNFKTVMTEVYDKFKQRKLAQFEAAQAELAATEPEQTYDPGAPAINDKPYDPSPTMATGDNTPMPAKPANIDAKTRAIIGQPPVQYVSGTVPVMVRSMESGQVKEIKPGMITYWGRMHYESIHGEPYWVGRVDYTASSIFGIFPTQAKALIRQNKVIKWIYAGSEEPVP